MRIRSNRSRRMDSAADAVAFDTEWEAYRRWYRTEQGREVPWQPTLGPER